MLSGRLKVLLKENFVLAPQNTLEQLFSCNDFFQQGDFFFFPCLLLASKSGCNKLVLPGNLRGEKVPLGLTLLSTVDWCIQGLSGKVHLIFK
jgi:hypothetical protein